MRRLFGVVALAVGCGSKDNGVASVESPFTVGTAAPASAGAKWSAVISAGKASGLVGLASGPFGTIVVSGRGRNIPVAVNGVEALAGSSTDGDVFVRLDSSGKLASTHLLDLGGQRASFVVTDSDATVAIHAVEVVGKGAIATLSRGAMTPVDGNVLDLARSASGAVWVTGARWGSEDSLSTGKCDRKAFIARRSGSGAAELVMCSEWWEWMRVTAIDEDVVLCGSQLSSTTEVGNVKLAAQTFSFNESVTAGGVTVNGPGADAPAVGVVRIPLPLPAP